MIQTSNTIDTPITLNPSSSVTTSISTGSNINPTTFTTTTVTLTRLTEPWLLSHQIYDDRVEFIYRQTKWYSYTPSPPTEELVYKIVVTFENGKTVQTRVDGEYIPPSDELYIFNEED